MSLEFVKLQYLRTGHWDDLPAVARSVARHLADGGLLGHPTSGVYGLGGRRDERCEKAIANLKGRAADQAFVYLVADTESARTEFPEAEWSPVATKLAQAFWPGPLTMVLADGTEGGVAVRAEDHPVTRAVLEQWGRAMSSTSLNRTGDPPARTEAEAMAALRSMPGSDLPILMIGAGDLGQSPPSTLVLPGSTSFEVLREGAIPRAALQAALN